MDNATELLVVILASTLTVFLVVAIIATMKVIQVLDHLKLISEKAEKLANTAENVGEFFKYTAGPAAIAKLIANVSDIVFKNHKRKDKNDE